MTPDWTEDQPIYRQLRDKVVDAIMDGSLKEGEPLPSVRTVAVELQINPITASKAYQELVGEQLVEKRRGLGLFVVEGARGRLLAAERRRFMEQEWPKVLERMKKLELDARELLKTVTNGNAGGVQ